jgi:hypothetical protein
MTRSSGFAVFNGQRASAFRASALSSPAGAWAGTRPAANGCFANTVLSPLATLELPMKVGDFVVERLHAGFGGSTDILVTASTA